MNHAEKSNEERSEDEELVSTGHRDERSMPDQYAANDQPALFGDAHRDDSSREPVPVHTTEGDPRDALAALGEDVSSSAARRGQHTPDEITDP